MLFVSFVFHLKEEALGRPDFLPSFDMAQTTYKMKKLGGGHRQAHSEMIS
jgi:hypothetical protein